MKKFLILSLALLTLSAGLWAENPQGSPAGPITCNGLHFNLVSNEHVELVKYKDIESVPYKGDIVVPDQFEFTDTQEKVYTLTVIWIGDYAFADSPELTSVTLPATISKIGDNAFANSTSLKSVTCLGTEPATLETDVFAGSQPTIYVPRGTVDTYKDAWSAYENLISLTDLDQAKEDAIREIQTTRQGIRNTEINQTIDNAVNLINNATDEGQINSFLSDARLTIGLVQIGKAEAKAELPTDAEDAAGHTVTITKGDKTLTLINPDKVSYGKQ